MLEGCPKLHFTLQKSRHDGVVIQIVNEIVEGLKLGNKFKLQDMGEKLECGNETVKIVLDQRVFLERKDPDEEITLRFPVIWSQMLKKTIFITEVAVSAEELIKDKFAEKVSKYVPLCKHLQEKNLDIR